MQLLISISHILEVKLKLQLFKIYPVSLKPTTEEWSIDVDSIKLNENLAANIPNQTTNGTYSIASLTLVFSYETGIGRNTKAIHDFLNYLLNDKSQAKAPWRVFVPIRGDIL